MKRNPLPFVGSKARYRAFYEQIQNLDEHITDVYDLFGGSFYCGYLVKFLHPNVRVHINTYGSNYMSRLSDWERTKSILKDLRNLMTTETRDQKLTSQEVGLIKTYIKCLGEDVDYETLSNYLCYKTNANAQTKEQLLAKPFSQFYQLVPKNLDKISQNVEHYLSVLSTCDMFCTNYFDFVFPENTEHTLFIIDPPYIGTKNYTYEEIDDKKLVEIFSILFTNRNMIYFGSNKNPLMDLLEVLSRKGFLDITLINTKRKNSHVVYYDIMVIKKERKECVYSGGPR